MRTLSLSHVSNVMNLIRSRSTLGSLLEGMADDDDLDYVITLALDDIGQGDPEDNYPDDLDRRSSSVTCRKLTKEEADKSRPDMYIG
jgi:hypothetical protein